MLTGGAHFSLTDNLTATITARYLGPAALIEDNSIRSDASSVVNGRIAYRTGRFTVSADALNLFDSSDNDITYYYASRLPGEPVDGVEDEHFHPIPPRSLRLQVRAALF